MLEVLVVKRPLSEHWALPGVSIASRLSIHRSSVRPFHSLTEHQPLRPLPWTMLDSVRGSA